MTEEIEEVKEHVNSFQYEWIDNEEISEWYSRLQKLLSGEKDEEIEFRVIRIRGKMKKYIGVYRFKDAELIKDIINFMNSKCLDPILERYVKFLEGSK